MRNRWFQRSILIGSLAVAVAAVFTRSDCPDWLQRNARLCWGVAIGCRVMACVTFRKQQFARFSRRDGPPGLDICSAGPDRARFGDFVAQIQHRIRRAWASQKPTPCRGILSTDRWGCWAVPANRRFATAHLYSFCCLSRTKSKETRSCREQPKPRPLQPTKKLAAQLGGIKEAKQAVDALAQILD